MSNRKKVTSISGNVFADLGFANPEEELLNCALASAVGPDSCVTMSLLLMSDMGLVRNRSCSLPLMTFRTTKPHYSNGLVRESDAQTN
jgi:hypothetical protein